MKKLSRAQVLFHMIIEKDASTMGFGTSSYTIWIDERGEPVIKTLKVTKGKRIKYNGK